VVLVDGARGVLAGGFEVAQGVVEQRGRRLAFERIRTSGSWEQLRLALRVGRRGQGVEFQHVASLVMEPG
jgi:hypothetical protein